MLTDKGWVKVSRRAKPIASPLSLPESDEESESLSFGASSSEEDPLAGLGWDDDEMSGHTEKKGDVRSEFTLSEALISQWEDVTLKHHRDLRGWWSRDRASPQPNHYLFAVPVQGVVRAFLRRIGTSESHCQVSGGFRSAVSSPHRCQYSPISLDQVT